MVLAAVVVVLIGFGDIAMDEAATIGCATGTIPQCYSSIGRTTGKAKLSRRNRPIGCAQHLAAPGTS